MAEFNLKDLYRSAFGYVAPPFPIGGIPDITNLLPIKNIEGALNPTSNLSNGAGIRMPFSLRIVGDIDYYQLPNEPIVSISGGKNIVSTSLTRSNEGIPNKVTVKEEINLLDYRITIKGIAINSEENDFPETIIADIRELCESQGALDINNRKCRVLGIFQGVVTGMRFPENGSLPFRAQPYEITLMSDQPFELELLKPIPEDQ